MGCKCCSFWRTLVYNNRKVLCVIPARGGSKGLPGKNIKLLCGKPLIAYTIEHALVSALIDRVVVSTEDERIADVAVEFGAEVPFMRPPELAGDDSGTIDVLLHAMTWLETREGYDFDILVLLHVTTPLRIPADIDRCIQLLVEKNADSIFSVTEAHRNPYFNMIELDSGGRPHLAKEGSFRTRQSAPPVYDMNSSIYVWWKDAIKEKKCTLLDRSLVYIMPKERSIDIDDHIDFRVAEMLLKERS
jgi:CMP-N-acetylneuraminic acid synthetase